MIGGIIARRLTGGLLCVATLALNGCGGTEPRSTAAASDAPAPQNDSGPADPGSGEAVPQSCDNLHESILAAAPTREAFAGAYGPPDTVIATTEPNRHVPGAVDSLFTVAYAGFVMEIRTPAGARDMATHVEVEDNRYLAFPGIGIGAPAERLEDVLGPPTSASAGRVTYDCSEAVEQPVTFVIEDGRVARIEIAYYVD